MKWTEKQINDIINLRTRDRLGGEGIQIDIFNTYGVLYVMNPAKDGGWDLTENCVLFSQGSLAVHISDFEYCETEDDVHEAYHEALSERAESKLGV